MRGKEEEPRCTSKYIANYERNVIYREVLVSKSNSIFKSRTNITFRKISGNYSIDNISVK